MAENKKIMRPVYRILLSALLALGLAACDNDAHKSADAVIKTNFGNIYVKLYAETPKHRENFMKLAGQGYYNGTRFHRIIKDFMIQGGDPNSKDTTKRSQWGQGEPGYTLEAEILPTFIHKRGTLAAARLGDEGNPDRRSSGSQFFIVEGRKITDGLLDTLEKNLGDVGMRTWMRNTFMNSTKYEKDKKEAMTLQKQYQESNGKEPGQAAIERFNKRMMAIQEEMMAEYKKANKPFKYTPEQRAAYIKDGGAPFLDMQYTVFGEVVAGMEVVDKIAALKTDPTEKPIQHVTMEVSLLNQPK